MATYTSRTAGTTEPVQNDRSMIARIDSAVRVESTAREYIRTAKSGRPEQPVLRWQVTGQGLRMNWSDQSRAR